MKDEILGKALASDTEIVPRYDVVLPDGTKVAENAEIVLKNPVTQEGTPYNKESVLQDETASLYGLDGSATVDGVLQYIGKYNLHWWKRRAKSFTVGDEISVTTSSDYQDIVNVSVSNKSSASASTTYYYSTQIGFEGDTLALTGTVGSARVSYNNFPNDVDDNLAGKYFISVTGKYWLASESCSAQRAYEEGDSLVWVTPIKEVVPNIGDWEYVYSENRNEYPDSGMLDGYEYVYMGVPFENAKFAPKMVVGSYYGTGAYGPNNKNSLTFDGEVAFIFITCGDSVSFLNVQLLTGVTYSTTDTSDFEGTLQVSYENNTVYWYSSNSEYVQQNKNTCGYIAFLI